MWLHEIIDDPKKKALFLVTEYYTGGSLHDKVTEKNKKFEDHNLTCQTEGRISDMKTVGLYEWEAR